MISSEEFNIKLGGALGGYTYKCEAFLGQAVHKVQDIGTDLSLSVSGCRYSEFERCDLALLKLYE